MSSRARGATVALFRDDCEGGIYSFVSVMRSRRNRIDIYSTIGLLEAVSLVTNRSGTGQTIVHEGAMIQMTKLFASMRKKEKGGSTRDRPKSIRQTQNQ